MIRLLLVIAVLGCGESRPRPASPPPVAPADPLTGAPPPRPQPPSGGDAVEIERLRRAIVDVDPANPRSVDGATKAAQAIGEARLVALVPELAGLAARPTSKKLVLAQVAALTALGRLAGEKSAVAALTKIVDREPPARVARDELTLHLMLVGKSLDALAELRDPDAIASVMLVVYRTPELAQQWRRAMLALGPSGAAEFRKVLRGEHAAVEQLFRARKLDRYCGDKQERPAAQCEPVSLRDFYAAMILGDFRAGAARGDLMKALERPAQPAYYVEDSPGNSQHLAVFDTLRKVGTPEEAAPLYAMWKKPQGDLEMRIGAIMAYAFAARDTIAVDELGTIAADNSADDGLRQEAARAYARLARDAKQTKPLLVLAGKYLDASDKKRREADRLRPRARPADAAFAKATMERDAAKQKLVAIAEDKTATADQIRAATEAAERAQERYLDARKVHREKTAPLRAADDAARAYRGYARMFQTHVAPIELAGRCRDDVRCYQAALEVDRAAATRQLAKHVPGTETWTTEEQDGIVDAYLDRALLELGKRGPKVAGAALPAVLAKLATGSRATRDAILLALPRLAPLPCPSCVTALDRELAKDEDGQTLELELARSYYRWAK